MSNIDIQSVKTYLINLQDSLCEAIEDVDEKKLFLRDNWGNSSDGGGGSTRILTEGGVIEKGGVGFSHVYGNELPASPVFG